VTGYRPYVKIATRPPIIYFANSVRATPTRVYRLDEVDRGVAQRS
jgi:hypothetical protein